MKEEQSAGGVVLKNISNIWHVLLIHDKNGCWTFPKGLIESDEEMREAARREVQEETGLKELSGGIPLQPISYWYHRDGMKIHKTVWYFVFFSHSDEKLIPQREEGIKDVRWMSIEDALHSIGYKDTNGTILKEAITTV
ncbi:MAG: NUDIX domain-containing protein [Patescibacteria group bacterium]|nr:NUDIX domain-containing protein [Patescibacteria group bacterium]